MEIALVWDKDTPLKRYLADSGFDCEIITPQLLAAPFFSPKACKLVIVPAGFGNSFFSGLLPDLRANSVHIANFVKAGGTLLVSGALSHRNAYNWLPLGVEYVRKDLQVCIERVKDNTAAMLVEQDECFCDGYFEAVEDKWGVIVTVKVDTEEKAILLVAEYGAGAVIVTTIHEYPSERFIAHCVGK